MSTLIDTPTNASHQNGFIHVRMESGQNLSFPVSENPRLSTGSDSQLNNIEISPFGLHWPDLDEDLSLRGILAGNHGQQ